MKSSAKITSIIAHIDHGKTTVMDTLIAAEGHISKSLAGDLRYMDSRPDEQHRKITLKLGLVQLKNGHIFIDTPGHIDFESLIFCSSILADNFAIIIDINEGITPRTYSLVKYICKERAVLLLNKVDRAESFDKVQLVVHQMNALMGEDIFFWEKNNVILCCASLCAGLSYGVFRFSKTNTLKSAFSAFKLLERKYDGDDVQSLMEKYKIKFKTKKNLFSTIMPLHFAIFDSIEKISGNNSSLISSSEAGEYKFSSNFYEISVPEPPIFLGIIIYGIFKEKHVYTKDNVIFVAKMLHGKINKNDVLHSTSSDDSRKAIVEHLYLFNVDKFVEVESAEAPGIVGIQGDFLKNSALSNIPVSLNLQSFLTPFHFSKIILKDLNQLSEIKETIKAIYLTEQCFKVRKNRFAELEMRCSGAVQFEKICNDLLDAGYLFDTKGAWLDFCEYPTRLMNQHYSDENAEFTISIGNAEDEESGGTEEGNLRICGRNGNVFIIKSIGETNVIESVLEIFIDSGPLIRSNIINALISVDVSKEEDARFYNTLKNELTVLYMKTEPNICPRLFGLKISTERNYVDKLYIILEKNLSVVDDEDFNENVEFSILHCRVPQLMLQGVLQEINIETKGTAYVGVTEAGYAPIRDFSSFIESIRTEKGLFTNKVITENPEKQRTLRK
ncbi:hypothetical protein PAEPH01_0806 [Pancytospora epiphaga]|nr:hypothetical protein PAEPH01_0806 [Pancytospora epiphaga]